MLKAPLLAPDNFHWRAFSAAAVELAESELKNCPACFMHRKPVMMQS